jgi:Zn ribbon nucleic-acid-binding protein
MFRFPLPAAPQLAPTPCPHCGTHDVVAVYATVHVDYLRCVSCCQVRALSRVVDAAQADQDSGPAAAA